MFPQQFRLGSCSPERVSQWRVSRWLLWFIWEISGKLSTEMLKQEHQDFLPERMDEANQNKGNTRLPLCTKVCCILMWNLFYLRPLTTLSTDSVPTRTACHQRMTSDEQQFFFLLGLMYLSLILAGSDDWLSIRYIVNKCCHCLCH